MSFVVDSSIALAWCSDDERTQATDALLQALADAPALAPSLWALEVLNALAVSERRGRIDSAKRRQLGELLRALPIELDEETAVRAWRESAELAVSFGLSVYDAAYLELAQRTARPLATLDKALRAAAKACGVALLGLAADRTP